MILHGTIWILDEVYQVMDHTTSSVGAEYLYYLLRTPVLSEEKLKERDRLMEFFHQK